MGLFSGWSFCFFGEFCPAFFDGENPFFDFLPTSVSALGSKNYFYEIVKGKLFDMIIDYLRSSSGLEFGPATGSVVRNLMRVAWRPIMMA